MEPHKPGERPTDMAPETPLTDADDRAVAALLASTPVPAMPLDVWTRISAALAIESANRNVSAGFELPNYTMEKQAEIASHDKLAK
ncbi:MAG: hypothetical protein ACRCWS_00090 [Propionibacteriaceae bacterium]